MLQSPLQFESTWYHSRDTNAIRLNKPIPHEEIHRLFPNIKGIRIEFGKTEFKPLKINHDEYLEKLLDTFDFEELIIESGNRLTKFPDNLWKTSLKRLTVNQIGSEKTVELHSNASCQLEGLSINYDYIKPSNQLFSLPTLKEIHVTNCSNLAILNKAINLQSISLLASETHIGLDLQNFPNLIRITIRPTYYKQIIDDKLNFSKSPKLKEIFLSSFRNFPTALGDLPELQQIYLTNIGNPENLGIFRFKNNNNLTSISLENCHLDYHEASFLGEMPIVEEIRIQPSIEYKPQLNSRLFTSKNLTNVYISNCSLPIDLERKPIKNLQINQHLSDDRIQKLSPFEYIVCYDIDDSHLNNEDWQNLPNLKQISIARANNLIELPPFNEKNIALESIMIDNMPILASLPNSWVNSQSLTYLSIFNCPNLVINNWTTFPSLKTLTIHNKVKAIPKEILLWKNISSISIDKSNISERNIAYLEDITKITLDTTLDNNTKLVIGSILFENGVNIDQIPDFKASFLNIFNTKSFRFKQMAWDNLHLINDNSTLSLELLAQKSIGLLGKTKNIKTYYKDKLISLGSSYKAKVDAQTEVIVVGESFELPENFWNYSHIFISEAALDNLIKNFQPGFIQTLADDEIHNLRKLLWSNEIENEKIVVEMIKGGGIAEAIIPDLMVVAKTSKDNSVKTSLKKLLKAKLSAGGQKILSDKINLKRPPSYRNPYELYHSFDNQFDVAQMALTCYKRGGESLHDFFKIKGSEQNPYRNEVFLAISQQFLVKNHVVDARWGFTNEEISFILSQEVLKGNLKRLYLGNCDLAAIIPALSIHKDTLEEFSFSTSVTSLPEEINIFQKIKKLSVTANNLDKLPVRINEMKKLKELFIYSDKKLILDEQLKNLINLPHFYCLGGFEIAE